MPDGRTAEYALWRACERLHIHPPTVQLSWDDNDVWAKAKILAYEQIRAQEELEEEKMKLEIIARSRASI